MPTEWEHRPTTTSWAHTMLFSPCRQSPASPKQLIITWTMTWSKVTVALCSSLSEECHPPQQVLSSILLHVAFCLWSQCIAALNGLELCSVLMRELGSSWHMQDLTWLHEPPGPAKISGLRSGWAWDTYCIYTSALRMSMGHLLYLHLAIPWRMRAALLLGSDDVICCLEHKAVVWKYG